METSFKQIRILILSTLLIALAIINGCANMSEIVTDRSAGLNGSFEVTKSGLPVNWHIYSPGTIPSGNYKLIFDNVVFKSGKQSLKFDVKDCSSDGGWLSPGCFQTVPASTGKSYKISFWLKNQECEYRLLIGSERPQMPGYHSGKTYHSKESIPNWKQFEHQYTIPEGFENIKFELNILQPGVLWLDDVKIEEL